MTQKRKLGTDITALIHHVQLNESGWFDRAIGRAIKFMLWLNDEPLSLDYLIANQAEVGLNHITKINIVGALDSLCQSGDLIEVQKDIYKLSEIEKRNVGGAVNQAEKTEIAVRNKILHAAHRKCGVDIEEDGNDLWERFHRLFTVPFIQETGARSYELITGTSPENKQSAFLADLKRSISRGRTRHHRIDDRRVVRQEFC